MARILGAAQSPYDGVTDATHQMIETHSNNCRVMFLSSCEIDGDRFPDIFSCQDQMMLLRAHAHTGQKVSIPKVQRDMIIWLWNLAMPPSWMDTCPLSQQVNPICPWTRIERLHSLYSNRSKDTPTMTHHPSCKRQSIQNCCRRW